NDTVDGTGHCNNHSAVNCNNYTGKQFAWMNGGPAGSCLADGTYFFAVTTSSGDPNDGQAGNLSDDFDAYTNRTFTIAGCVLTYNGTHTVDVSSNKIRLADYGASPNGVYKMHICNLAGGIPVPSDACKTDNFKVQPGSTTGGL